MWKNVGTQNVWQNAKHQIGIKFLNSQIPEYIGYMRFYHIHKYFLFSSPKKKVQMHCN